MKIIVVNKEPLLGRHSTFTGWTRALLSVCLLGIPTFIGAWGYSWLIAEDKRDIFNTDVGAAVGILSLPQRGFSATDELRPQHMPLAGPSSGWTRLKFGDASRSSEPKYLINAPFGASRSALSIIVPEANGLSAQAVQALFKTLVRANEGLRFRPLDFSSADYQNPRYLQFHGSVRWFNSKNSVGSVPLANVAETHTRAFAALLEFAAFKYGRVVDPATYNRHTHP